MIFGGILGGIDQLLNINLHLNKILISIFGLSNGIFIGCLAVSLAEVLDVIPILTRRVRVEWAIPIFMLVIALAKSLGSILYFLIPGFY